MSVLVAAILVAESQSAAVRRVAQELVRVVESRFARETVEALEPRIVRAIECAGDDAVRAIRRAGPAGLRAVESHGVTGARLIARWGDDGVRLLADDGAVAARVYASYGDEAVEAMLRHPGSGGRIVESLGPAGVRAARPLGQDGAVQLAAVAPSIARSGRAAEVMAVVERFGDRACAFLWRNKGVVFGAVLLAAFLSDPEPYIAGVRELVVTPAREVGREAVARTDWTIVTVSALVLAAIAAALRFGIRPRRETA
jgi:hypothetical protein